MLSSVFSYSNSVSLKGGPDGTGKESEGLNKKKLIHIVDSLLDLDAIDPKEVELIIFYNELISNTIETEKETKDYQLSNLNLYEGDMMDGLMFHATPDKELSESLVLEIENDDLGYYNAPIEGVITSLYGWRDKRMHNGIDLDLIKGQPVVAAFDGKVRIAKANGGYGKVVILMHANGLETVYAHLSKFKVKPGDVVLAGQPIGLGGSTGHSTGSHLHFEVRYKGHALNPSTFISFEEHKLLHPSIILKKSKWGLCAFPSNANFHVVQKGDNWHDLAKMYGLTQKELCALNGTQKRYYLKVGQKVRIN